MIIFCLLLMIGGSIGKPYYEHTLTNKYFDADINNNGILLNNKYNIKYERFSENNKHVNINFNNFYTHKDYSISTISAKMKYISIVHESTENTTRFLNNMKKYVKYENDKLYVSINIEHWNFSNKYNDLDFEFSIDKSKMIDNNSIYINNEFIITFNEKCIVDGYDETIHLSESHNKYKIHFPSFEHYLYYQFIITYNNNIQHNKKSNYNINTWIICILIICGFIYKKY